VESRMAFIFLVFMRIMEEDNQNINKEKNNQFQNEKGYWRPVMLFYAKTTSWVIFPLILAVLGGKYVGKTFESQSLFFIFVALGFLITCFGIYREIKKYKKNLEEKNGK